jgi:hypothetical protein
MPPVRATASNIFSPAVSMWSLLGIIASSDGFYHNQSFAGRGKDRYAA